jgi:hypothetical protein
MFYGNPGVEMAVAQAARSRMTGQKKETPYQRFIAQEKGLLQRCDPQQQSVLQHNEYC